MCLGLAFDHMMLRVMIMIETLLIVVLALLALFGVVGLIKLAALSIAAPKNNKTRIYAVLLKSENADIELQMAMDAVEWDSALGNSTKYAIDCGLNDVERELCAKLCKGTDFMFVSALEMADKFYSEGVISEK